MTSNIFYIKDAILFKGKFYAVKKQIANFDFNQKSHMIGQIQVLPSTLLAFTHQQEVQEAKPGNLQIQYWHGHKRTSLPQDRAPNDVVDQHSPQMDATKMVLVALLLAY